MSIRQHHEPLPQGLTETMEAVKAALKLSGVLEVKITPEGIDIVRDLANPEDEVFPRIPNALDLEFLLERIDLTAQPYNEAIHPFYSLLSAVTSLEEVGDFIGLVAPEPELFAAWLGVDGLKSKRVMGLEVRYVDAKEINSRVIALGGPKGATSFMEATHGVAIDMGIQ